MGTRKLKTKKNRGNYIVSNRDGMRILDESHNFPKELPPDFLEFTKALVLGPAPYTATQIAEWHRLRPYIEALTAEERGSVVSWNTSERVGRTHGMRLLRALAQGASPGAVRRDRSQRQEHQMMQPDEVGRAITFLFFAVLFTGLAIGAGLAMVFR